MVPETADCVVCGKPFTSITMVHQVPSFLCKNCLEKVANDKLYMFSRSDSEVKVYIPRGMEYLQLLDEGVTDVILNPHTYHYHEPFFEGDAKCQNFDLGSVSLSGIELVHLASKAKHIGRLNSFEIGVVLCVGLGKMWRCRLNESQLLAEHRMLDRLIDAGVTDAPCSEERCRICEAVRSQLKRVTVEPLYPSNTV